MPVTAFELVLVRAMVSDFNRMIRDVRGIANEFSYLATLLGAPRTDCVEVQEFLQWLLDENFVFMGLEALARDGGGVLQPNPERSLGIARHPRAPTLDQEGIDFLTSHKTIAWPLARVPSPKMTSHDLISPGMLVWRANLTLSGCAPEVGVAVMLSTSK